MSDSRTHTPTPWDTVLGDCGEYIVCGPNVGVTSVATKRDAEHIVHCVNSHDGLVEALRAITEAAGNYCQAIDDIGTSGEPPEEHVDRLDALEECIRDALVVSRRALEAAGITEATDGK